MPLLISGLAPYKVIPPIRRFRMARWGRPAVKMLAEYLDHALEFELMAGREQNLETKAKLERQAEAYRELATERAKLIGIGQGPTKH